jgi:hypothetical protein
MGNAPLFFASSQQQHWFNQVSDAAGLCAASFPPISGMASAEHSHL